MVSQNGSACVTTEHRSPANQRDKIRVSQQEIWENSYGNIPVALSALLAALNVAGLLPAPELGVIPNCGVVRFIVGIKVVLHGPNREVPAVALLHLGIDVKHLIVLLKLVHQGRHRLEGTKRAPSSLHSRHHPRHAPEPVFSRQQSAEEVYIVWHRTKLYCRQAHFVKHGTGICIL